ncbi:MULTISPECIES: DUF397 domain-containing protein [Micromonospora]|uniref:DUF397 domain-containing protein n=1 Tax=Micromonospora TaxID=1873 RepID=UPI0009E3938B|nr:MULTISPECIES: DUF397 domain-containing protein [unclassified Micromonospora]MDG4756165.1 DUF397 domain-containing protein [Micromonospora sp. WMMD718]
MRDPNFTNWRKSTRSSGGANCVEVAHDAATVGVRDTKDRTGGTLLFPTDGWRAFLGDVREGVFDPS